MSRRTISFPSLGITLDVSNLKGESMNEHVAAIESEIAAIRTVLDGTIVERHVNAVQHHLDALARQLAEAEARCEAYKQGWDALGPFCTKQFRGDDPSITDEELHAFCVARRTIWELEHGDLPESEATDEAE